MAMWEARTDYPSGVGVNGNCVGRRIRECEDWKGPQRSSSLFSAAFQCPEQLLAHSRDSTITY